jgi:hypothetical protein
MSRSRDRARDGRSRCPRCPWRPSRPSHRSRRRSAAGLAGAALWAASLLLSTAARADVRVTLQNAFIEKYKERATIEAAYSVDSTRARPLPPASDGDLHAAGRAPEIGLAAVAEVMNAAQQPEAAELVRRAERSHQPLAVRGVWRLWCEQGGDSEHVQGRPVEPFKTASPPHVFEIHPVLRLGDQDLAGSLRPIAGRTYEDAGQAFRNFEQLPSRITAGDGMTTITTRMAGASYVDFVIRLNEEPTHALADGLAVKAAVLDARGELLVEERRMVAAAGTAPYARLKALHRGDSLHVAGVPRIDLALLSWRVANRGRVPGILDWSLPYEMVLVAVLPDPSSGANDAPPPTPDPAAPATDAAATAAVAGAAAGAAATAVPAGAAADPPDPPAAAGPPAAVGASGAPAIRAVIAGALPVEPLVPIVTAAPANLAEGDVVAILLKLLSQSVPAGALRGACTVSSRQRSDCAALTGPQCDQLGGAFDAGEKCPPADPAPGPAAANPADPAPGAAPPDPPAP